MTGNIQTLITESVMAAKAGRNILEVIQKQEIMVSLVAVSTSFCPWQMVFPLYRFSVATEKTLNALVLHPDRPKAVGKKCEPML